MELGDPADAADSLTSQDIPPSATVRFAGMPVVYLLRCGCRTYVGATLQLERRLRQHNGEIVGGARQTAKGGPWVLACRVSGFRSFNEALKFEFAWRREGRRRRQRGCYARKESLVSLMKRERWSSTSPLASDVPLEVAWL